MDHEDQPSSSILNPQSSIRSEAASTLRVIPLGGLGEIGMNLMVYECGDDAIVVDCGMMFPDATTMGVDVIVPDMTYLFDNASKIRALFLTHGHEDHIGAVPFLVERLPLPIYGMPLTLGFVADKFEEFGIDNIELRAVMPRDVVEVGSFRIEAIRVTHSIVDALGYAITTPAGTIIHTGDFKIDHTPIDAKPTDLARFAHHGEQGVLLLVSDSTNALVPGHCPSERTVGSALDRIFANANGRILVTTFASHIHRVQQIIDLAKKFRRKVLLVGRSLVDNVETAERLGYLRIPREVRAPSADLPARDLVILTTGTQGEPSSALSRMAIGEHKQVEIERGDVVVISARTIPGNERAVAHVIDHLYRRGADVVHHEQPDVHVSGHACQEELKLMLNVTRPKFFIPMHGTLRHLIYHARLAKEVGVPHGVVITNGQVVEIGGDSVRVLEERVTQGKVFIDSEAEEVPEVVVRDRQHLAEDGFVIAVVAVDSNGRLIRDPEIITRGLVHVDESQEILADVQKTIADMFAASPAEELRDPDLLQEKMRAMLKRYFRKSMGARPMILPVIWEM
ncbi:MAG: ribonuclease J [Acidobacteria bacterium]|nr:MAG: ribonuclease J [Acidobacteriota bacterium]